MKREFVSEKDGVIVKTLGKHFVSGHAFMHSDRRGRLRLSPAAGNCQRLKPRLIVLIVAIAEAKA